MNDITHRIDRTVKYDLAHSIGHIHDHGLDYDSDIIYLMDDIDRESMAQFIKNINILQRKDKCDTILVYMSTCGGCWDSGMEIFNAIKACPKTVVVLGGFLYSMGSVILQAADKRVLYSESRIMIHDGDFNFEGTTKQAETEVEQLKNAKKTMRRIFLDNMREADFWAKNKDTTILKWLDEQMNKKEEVYLSAEDSLKYGFIDQVFGKEDRYRWGEMLKL